MTRTKTQIVRNYEIHVHTQNRRYRGILYIYISRNCTLDNRVKYDVMHLIQITYAVYYIKISRYPKPKEQI